MAVALAELSVASSLLREAGTIRSTRTPKELCHISCKSSIRKLRLRKELLQLCIATSCRSIGGSVPSPGNLPSFFLMCMQRISGENMMCFGLKPTPCFHGFHVPAARHVRSSFMLEHHQPLLHQCDDVLRTRHATLGALPELVTKSDSFRT